MNLNIGRALHIESTHIHKYTHRDTHTRTPRKQPRAPVISTCRILRVCGGSWRAVGGLFLPADKASKRILHPGELRGDRPNEDRSDETRGTVYCPSSPAPNSGKGEGWVGGWVGKLLGPCASNATPFCIHACILARTYVYLYVYESTCIYIQIEKET